MAVRLTAEGRDCCHDYAAGWELGTRRRMTARTTTLLTGSWVRCGGWLHIRMTYCAAGQQESGDGCHDYVVGCWKLSKRWIAQRTTALPAKRRTAALRSCLGAWATRCTTAPLDWKYEDGWEFKDFCTVS